MKKKLLLTTLCLVVGMMALACGGQKPHTHTFGVWETVTEATCLTKGTEERTCACGEVETRPTELNPENHVSYWEWETVTPATYTENGEEIRSCECGDEETRPIERFGAAKKGNDALAANTISILAIGNSLSWNGTEYLSDVLHEVGFTNVTVGLAWSGGWNIPQHASAFKNNSKSYTWEYYTENEGWVTTSTKVSIEYAFEWADWDFVTAQTGGAGMGKPEMMAVADLSTIVGDIYAKTEDAVPSWYMTPSCLESTLEEHFGAGTTRQDYFDKAVTLLSERIVASEDWMLLLPTLTAVENFREGYGTACTCTDGVHLTYPIGCVLSALAWVKAMVPDADLTDVHLDYVPDAMMADMVAAVMAAVEKPFEVTPLTKTADTDLDGYATVKGFAVGDNGKITTALGNSMVVADGTFDGGVAEFDFTASVASDAGFVFGLSNPNSLTTFWEDAGVSYYMACVSRSGSVGIGAVNRNGTKWAWLNQVSMYTIPDFSLDKTYRIRVEWYADRGHIRVLVDGEKCIEYTDYTPLTGTGYGFRAGGAGTAFGAVTFSEELPALDYSTRSGRWNITTDKDGIRTFTNTTAESTIMFTEKELKTGDYIEYTFKVNGGYVNNYVQGIVFSETTNVMFMCDTAIHKDKYLVVGRTKDGRAHAVFQKGYELLVPYNKVNHTGSDVKAMADIAKTYEIKVECDFEACAFTIWVDGVKIATMTFTTKPLACKYFGFSAAGNGVVSIGNIRVNGVSIDAKSNG